MINISTKKGDQGKTRLASQVKISKADLRMDVIGDLDELNSWLGLVVVKFNEFDNKFINQRIFLLTIQEQLFKVGAELAQAEKVKVNGGFLIKIEKQSENLQQKMAKNWHNQFLLPGGSELASWLDVSRTVCRRAERNLVKLSQKEEIRPILLKVINRLSDYLYVLRCHVNYELGVEEKVKS